LDPTPFFHKPNLEQQTIERLKALGYIRLMPVSQSLTSSRKEMASLSPDIQETPIRLALKVFLAIAVLLLLCSCEANYGAGDGTKSDDDDASDYPSFPATEPSEPSPQGVNVVIHVIDTLRADRLGVYGYAKPTSPNIDALAAESVLFEQASAPAPWTLPSVVSLLTSTFPTEHGVLVDGQQISPRHVPLAERLRSAGYATISLSSNAFAGPWSGLHRGYDGAFVFDKSGPPLAPVRKWLDGLNDRLFFLYFHTTEPHDPYNPGTQRIRRFGQVSAETQSRINEDLVTYREKTKVDFKAGRKPGATDNTAEQDNAMAALHEARADIEVLYDAAIRKADDKVGRLIEELRQRKLWDRTLLILLSDHGEEFGDHGGWQHDQSLYEELVHVPLIIHFPGAQHAGIRVREPVRLIDIVPTIADILGNPEVGKDTRGDSLLRLFTGSGDPETHMTVVAERRNRKKYYRPYKVSRGDENIVVRQGHWKGIWNVEPDTMELYDLKTDPGEKRNLAGSQPDRADALARFARQWHARTIAYAVMRSAPGSPTLDEETTRSLRSLGYIQ
jgi:arylsulfatase A-like enzyme